MLDISLIITQDLDLLEELFNKTIIILKQRGLPAHLNKEIIGDSVVFRFTLSENNAQSSFLLPLTLASSLTDYITSYREKPQSEYLIKTHYWFIDNSITQKAVASLAEQNDASPEKEHRQMLVFFPLINYFSHHLPNLTWNMEGFINFSLTNYNLAVNDYLFDIINSLLCEKKKKEYQAMFHQSIKKVTHLTLLKGGKT